MDENEAREAHDWMAELTKDLIDRANEMGVRVAVVCIQPGGLVATRKTDNFKSLPEYIGIWEAAKFQDCLALWKANPQDTDVDGRSSGKPLPA